MNRGVLRRVLVKGPTEKRCTTHSGVVEMLLFVNIVFTTAGIDASLDDLGYETLAHLFVGISIGIDEPLVVAVTRGEQHRVSKSRRHDVRTS